jgi:hypothetical protein
MVSVIMAYAFPDKYQKWKLTVPGKSIMLLSMTIILFMPPLLRKSY